MTRHPRERLLRWGRVVVAGWGLCLAWPGHALAWGLPDLMQALSQTRSAKATFVEKKYIGFIDQPVESSGELSFTAPDRLEKRTLKPQVEVVRLTGTRMLVEQPGRRQLVLELGGRPDAMAFIESIRGTLAGDQEALERYYALDLQGNPEAWKLTLKPRFDDMRKVVTRIRMEGNQSVVSLVAFDQADGDRSEMRITRLPSP